MSDDFRQVLLRMPATLKGALEQEADLAHRSLTAECNLRLSASLGRDHSPAMVAERRAGYLAGLNEAERALLDLIRAMSPEKQGALLTVLKR